MRLEIHYAPKDCDSIVSVKKDTWISDPLCNPQTKTVCLVYIYIFKFQKNKTKTKKERKKNKKMITKNIEFN